MVESKECMIQAQAQIKKKEKNRNKQYGTIELSFPVRSLPLPIPKFE